ncbi:MAG: hypothetical protein GTO22_14565 [Gemmatimonadales bacterium]|nr:hypothetical protein [Gemmatimonadales bacterium]
MASTVDGSNFTVTAGEGDGFGANTVAGSLGLGGSVIQVGADDNSGAGYELTAVSGDTLTSTGAGWTPLVSEVVAPFAPAPSTSGSVVSHTLGSMTVGGTAFRITGAEFTLNRNLNYFKDEAFADGLSDANPGWREMSISMTLRARKDRIGELERRKRFTARAVTMVMGATAGNTWTLAMPTVEFMVGKMDVPDSPGGGEGTITIVGTPLDSAEGAADRATLAIT